MVAEANKEEYLKCRKILLKLIDNEMKIKIVADQMGRKAVEKLFSKGNENM